MSDIEGKVAREAMSECGQRASFNPFGVERVKRRGRHPPLRRWAFASLSPPSNLDNQLSTLSHQIFDPLPILRSELKFPSVRRKRSVALGLVFHLLGGIETRRHTIVTSPDWAGTTLAGRGRIVTPASVGIPREHAKTSSFGVNPAGTMRLSSAPESDGAQYHRVHSRVCSL